MKTELGILLHVVIASVLAGLIGIEREWEDKPAGIRTHMLVGGAVAMLVALGEIIVKRFYEIGLSQYINTDPTRVIQAIVVGISFIGAGLVLQIEKEHKIKFLTTSATILFASGIGIAVALHQYYLAVGITFFILFINYMLGKITSSMKKRKKRGQERKKRGQGSDQSD
jgi:putative Mg2+ transporter-C (MgtC) family protein